MGGSTGRFLGNLGNNLGHIGRQIGSDPFRLNPRSPTVPTAPSQRRGKISRLYSESRNTARLGQIIEANYGRVRITPPLAFDLFNIFIDNKQELRHTFVIGLGDYDFVDLYIGDEKVDYQQANTRPNPIVNCYQLSKNLTFDNLLFTPNKFKCKFFDNQEIKSNSEWIGWGRLSSNMFLSDILLNFILPYGLYNQDNSHSFNLNVRLRDVDTHTIHTATDTTLSANSSNQINIIGYYTGRQFEPSINSDSSYELQIKRARANNDDNNIQDRVNIHSVYITLRGRSGYSIPPYTLLQTITADGELLSNSNKVNFQPLVQRKLQVQQADGSFRLEATNSPAWAFYDILKTANVEDDNIDLAGLRALSTYITENNLEFNHSFSEQTNLWETLTTIADVCLCIVSIRDGKFGLYKDEPTTDIIQVFNENNILRDSLNITYDITTPEKNDGVLIEWIQKTTLENKVYFYKRDIEGEFITLVNPLEILLESQLTDAQAKLIGKRANYKLFNTMGSVSFTTEAEGRKLKINDKIKVMHQLFSNNVGGSVVGAVLDGDNSYLLVSDYKPTEYFTGTIVIELKDDEGKPLTKIRCLVKDNKVYVAGISNITKKTCNILIEGITYELNFGDDRRATSYTLGNLTNEDTIATVKSVVFSGFTSEITALIEDYSIYE